MKEKNENCPSVTTLNILVYVFSRRDLLRLHLVRNTNGLSYLYALLAHSRKSDLSLT